MSVLICSAITLIFLGRYYSVLNANIYKTLSEKSKKSARRSYLVMAGGLFLTNFIAILVAKPVPYVTYVLVTLYLIFIIILTLSVKIWVHNIPVYDKDGKKEKDDYGNDKTVSVKDKALCMKILFAVWCLTIPSALCMVYAKASLAGTNFSNPLKTVKGFLWTLILPLIVVGIVALIHYLRISGIVLKFGDWLEGDEDETSEDEEEPCDHREDPDQRDIYSDSSLDPNSKSNSDSFSIWWEKNGVIAVVAGILVVCAVICLCILQSNGVI